MTAWPVKRGKKNGIKLEMIIQDELSKCYRFKEVAALAKFFCQKTYGRLTKWSYQRGFLMRKCILVLPGTKILPVITRWPYLTGFSYKKMYDRFTRNKITGRNNEVAARRGSSIVVHNLGKTLDEKISGCDLV